MGNAAVVGDQVVYECCVSNHAQGWPKYIARQFAIVPPTKPGLAAGLAAIFYFDSNATEIELGDGNIVSVVTSTRYPFEDVVTFAVTSARDFTLSMRIPGWCKGAAVAINAASESETIRQEDLPAGMMASASLKAGVNTVTLTLPLQIRVVRRPAYLLSANSTIERNAATVWRGPLLYAVPRDFTLIHDNPYDDRPGLFPVGQAHGQQNLLLGTGSWAHALRISDDDNPGKDLAYVAAPNAPTPPKGQGPFSSFLVPGYIKAKAQLLPEWQSACCGSICVPGGNRVGQCSGSPACNTSIVTRQKLWVGLPPQSPVPRVATQLVSIILLPFGATDLRVAELPTTSAADGGA